MEYRFSDLVDIRHLRELMLPFYELTGIPYAILDADGNILDKIGWREICDDFHRVCPKSEKNCRESDSYISSHLHDGPFIRYQCLNGLMDYAIPIIIEGLHLATLFTGQFLHEPPDEEYFRRQAREFGFDESAYIEALRMVPIIPKERAESIVVFFSQFAQFLALLGLEKKRQLEAADQALKKQKERLRLVLESSDDGFYDWDIETGEVYYSPRWIKMANSSPESMEPHIRAWEKLIHHDDKPSVMKQLCEHLAGHTARFESEYRLLTGSGDWKWVMGRGKVMERDENGRPLRMVGTLLDVTELKQAKEALEAEHYRTLSLLERLPASVFLITPGHEVVFTNIFIREMYGKLLNKRPCYEILHGLNAPCGDCPMEDVLKKNATVERECVTILGRSIHNYYYSFVDIDGSLLMLALGIDITEQKRLDLEIARLDRLNLVGEMAAGIGHEIRNPMTAVRGFLQMLGEKDDCARYKDYFELMIDELDRANSIITEFLSLAKNKAVELKPKDLNNIVHAILPLISADAIVTDKYIEVVLNDVPNLLLDEKEIRQLILNLARNGLEAMSPGGLLTLKTFFESDEVVLAVVDQGGGIEPAVLEKIGTPFYTTKDNGTGLGLAVCYSIAARHKASITVDTGPAGTTFSVRFKTAEKNGS
ncbi:PocR ligand-binding domain-containing protein [Pelotomaculum propionicicum]|uniref:PocR ligand-binding domain-containing protein n=1 Tax=Pelotomaculum propionicicum TaxID=258475 RepID=UPI003B78305F